MSNDKVSKRRFKPKFNNKRKRKQRRRSNRTSTFRSISKVHSLLQAPPNYPQVHPKKIKFPKSNIKELTEYLSNLPEELVRAIYKSTGGQPSRISGFDRILQLTIKALTQENRIQSLVKDLLPGQYNTLKTLIECGGIGHSAEIIDELITSYGGSAKEWTESLNKLGELGIVATSQRNNGFFFYFILEPLLPLLQACLVEDLVLRPFESKEIQVPASQTLPANFDFMMVSLATYLHQHPPRLTQTHDIHKQDKDDLQQFFAQLWSVEKETFDFCLHFLLEHGMLSFQHSELTIVPEIVEEWINLSPVDKNALVFAKLDDDFSLVEWLFWVINNANGGWISERPLSNLYRRWILGDQWRQCFYEEDWSKGSNIKNLDSFATLVRQGFLEVGHWGQEKFYRLTHQAQSLIEISPKDEFNKFYLTPNFEIVAPMGTNVQVLFKLGELTEFHNCDRANTYKLTPESITKAQKMGWKRDDILNFFQHKSQIGIPENVDFTLKKWVGKQAEAEFHNILMLTLQRHQVKMFESNPAFKPFIVHRFQAGMYAIHPERKGTLEQLMNEAGLSVGDHVVQYPQGENLGAQKNHIEQLLLEANEHRLSLGESAVPDISPEHLQYIHTEQAKTKVAKPLSPEQTKALCEIAVKNLQTIKVLYHTKDGSHQWMTIHPERIAQSPHGYPILVGKTSTSSNTLGLALHKIAQAELLS